MTHEYSSTEIAHITGLSTQTIRKYVKQGALKPTDIVKAGGRSGFRYIFTEQSVKDFCDRIGIVPMWERSGRSYTEPPKAEPEETVEVLHEYMVIRLGEFYLTDNMGLDRNMDKAKRFATDGNESARQYRDKTNGQLVLIQTTAKEIE